jgi:hypothetical protein
MENFLSHINVGKKLFLNNIKFIREFKPVMPYNFERRDIFEKCKISYFGFFLLFFRFLSF